MRVFFVLVLSVFSPALFAENVARIVSMSGDVKVAGRSAATGEMLPKNSVVITGSDGSAKLLLADKSVVDVGRKTSFTVVNSIPDMGSATKLDFGTVRSSIRKKMDKKIKFQMRTATSVLAVRGTEFIVKSQTAKEGKVVQDQVTVSDGQVSVGSGGQNQVINPGQQFIAIGQLTGKEFQVSPATMRIVNLDTGSLATLTKEATVEDQTFRQTVEVIEDKPGATGGAATLAVAASVVASDTTVDAPKRPAETTQKPIDSGTVGNLNTVDGSKGQDKILTGAKLSVIFRP